MSRECLSEPPESLREHLDEHRIRISTMGRGLRSAVWGTAATILITMVLIAFRGHLGQEKLFLLVTHLPVAVVVITVILSVVALTLGLTGLFLSRSRAQYWMLGAFNALGLSTFIYACLTSPPGKPRVLSTLAFVSVSGLLWLLRHIARRLTLGKITGLTFAWVMILCVAEFSVMKSKDPGFAGGLFFLQTGTLLVFAAPFLLAVGGEFAEWGLFLAEWAAHLSTRRRTRSLALGVLFAVTAFNLAWPLVRYTTAPWASWQNAGLSLLAALLALVAITAIHRKPLASGSELNAGFGFPAMIAASFVVFWMSILGSAVNEPADPSRYFNGQFFGNPFSVTIPVSWRAKPIIQEHVRVAILEPIEKSTTFLKILPEFRTDVTGRSTLPHSTFGDLLGLGYPFSDVPMKFGDPDSEGWRTAETRASSRSGKRFCLIAWKKERPSEDLYSNFDWYLVGHGAEDKWTAILPMLQEIKASFRLDNRTVPSRRLRMLLAGACGGLGAIFALMLIYLPAHSRWRRLPLSVALVICWVLCLRGFLFQPEGVQLLDESLDASTLYTLQAAVALCTLGVILSVHLEWHRSETPIMAMAILGNLSLMLVALFTCALQEVTTLAEHWEPLKAIVVLIMLGWEVLTSGKSVTNRSSDAFPRNSRVLMYLAYALFIALAVFFFSSWNFEPSDRMVKAFDSEAAVLSGLVNLGLCAVLAKILARFLVCRPSPHLAAADAATPKQPQEKAEREAAGSQPPAIETDSVN